MSPGPAEIYGDGVGTACHCCCRLELTPDVLAYPNTHGPVRARLRFVAEVCGGSLILGGIETRVASGVMSSKLARARATASLLSIRSCVAWMRSVWRITVAFALHIDFVG